VGGWVEIRRLHWLEGLGIETIAWRLGVARSTVRAALAPHEPPKCERRSGGSSADVFDGAIRELLRQFPDMPATVIAERIGWVRSASVLRERVALLRPLFKGADPADRTTYVPGEVVQCDLWFPAKVVLDGVGTLLAPPVLTMVAAYSRFVMAVMLPTGAFGDLVAGMWSLLGGLGAVPKMLVWDNESGIGQLHRLTVGARGVRRDVGHPNLLECGRGSGGQGGAWSGPTSTCRPRSCLGARSPQGRTSTPSWPVGCLKRTAGSCGPPALARLVCLPRTGRRWASCHRWRP
jgi:hypothetical protein